MSAANVLAGEIYMWRDPQGRVHYSDLPPPDARDVRPLRRGGVAPAQGARERLADDEMAFRQRRAKVEERRAASQDGVPEVEERQRRCVQAKGQLAALESGQRAYQFNEQGEREFLDDTQREQHTLRTRQAVEAHCR
ncbi:MAG: DUF4124 domain-containing protein [Betaproteobacteria bacterium]|nr:DUF4124 domain-containing protein [Betaproteobacteria bacterium]